MIGGSSPGKDWEFSLHYHVQTGSGAHPAFYTVGTRGSVPTNKAFWREADHSPTSSTTVKYS
jgi:hypothetical protein